MDKRNSAPIVMSSSEQQSNEIGSKEVPFSLSSATPLNEVQTTAKGGIEEPNEEITPRTYLSEKPQQEDRPILSWFDSPKSTKKVMKKKGTEKLLDKKAETTLREKQEKPDLAGNRTSLESNIETRGRNATQKDNVDDYENEKGNALSQSDDEKEVLVSKPKADDVSLVIDIEAPVNEIFQFNAQASAHTSLRIDEELLPPRKFTKNPVSTIYDPYKIRPKTLKYKERDHPFKGWRMVNGARNFSSGRHLANRLQETIPGPVNYDGSQHFQAPMNDTKEDSSSAWSSAGLMNPSTEKVVTFAHIIQIDDEETANDKDDFCLVEIPSDSEFEVISDGEKSNEGSKTLMPKPSQADIAEPSEDKKATITNIKRPFNRKLGEKLSSISKPLLGSTNAYQKNHRAWYIPNGRKQKMAV